MGIEDDDHGTSNEPWHSQMPLTPASSRATVAATPQISLPSAPTFRGEPLFQAPTEWRQPQPTEVPAQTYSDPPLPPSLVAHFEICTPQEDLKSQHHCQICRKQFLQGDKICRLYDNHCFHEACLEKTMVRETYNSQTNDADHCGLAGTDDGDCENHGAKLVETEDGDHKPLDKVQLSTHCREYAAFPIQTKLKDGRPSIIIDPGSVGNLCGDKWAKEVALMAKANGRKPAHQRRERALQVSGVGNGSQQCHYDCHLPVAIRPEGGRVLQHGVLEVPAVENSDLPGLMGLSALKKNRAILDFNSLTLYFCGKDQYNLGAALPADTDRYQLETAPSGHLVLPCCEYKAGNTSRDYSLTLMAKSALPSSAAGKNQADAVAKEKPPPPSRSPPPVQEATTTVPPPPSTQPADPPRVRRGRSRSRQVHVNKD